MDKCEIQKALEALILVGPNTFVHITSGKKSHHVLMVKNQEKTHSWIWKEKEKVAILRYVQILLLRKKQKQKQTNRVSSHLGREICSQLPGPLAFLSYLMMRKRTLRNIVKFIAKGHRSTKILRINHNIIECIFPPPIHTSITIINRTPV